MTLGHEKLDVYGAILLKKNAQSTEPNEIDPDSDFDPDETKSQPDSGGNA